MCRAGLLAMVDVTLQSSSAGTRPGRQRIADILFRGTTQLFAFGVLVLLGAVMVALFLGGLPAFKAFGFAFLVDSTWNPVKQLFGGAPAIYGTLITSLIAMLIGVPLAL